MRRVPPGSPQPGPIVKRHNDLSAQQERPCRTQDHRTERRIGSAIGEPAPVTACVVRPGWYGRRA